MRRVLALAAAGASIAEASFSFVLGAEVLLVDSQWWLWAYAALVTGLLVLVSTWVVCTWGRIIPAPAGVGELETVRLALLPTWIPNPLPGYTPEFHVNKRWLPREGNDSGWRRLRSSTSTTSRLP